MVACSVVGKSLSMSKVFGSNPHSKMTSIHEIEHENGKEDFYIFSRLCHNTPDFLCNSLLVLGAW